MSLHICKVSVGSDIFWLYILSVDLYQQTCQRRFDYSACGRIINSAKADKTAPRFILTASYWSICALIFWSRTMSKTANPLSNQTGLEGLNIEHHVTLVLEDSPHLHTVLSQFASHQIRLNYILMRPVRNSGYEVALRVSDQFALALKNVIAVLREQSGVRSAQIEHLIARSGAR